MSKRKDSVDDMIEGWARGLGTSTRASLETDRGDLDGLSFAPKEGDTPELAAARKVREAMVAHTGRSCRAWRWSKIAREHLSLKRMSASRWSRIIKAGTDAGFFTLEGNPREGTLIAFAPPEPSKPRTRKVKRVEEPDPDAEPPPPSKNSDPSTHLDCGHWNYQQVPKDPSEYTGDEKKRMEAGGHMKVGRPYRTVKVEKPGPKHCPACKAGRPGNPRHQRGRFRKPVPEAQRRTLEKSGSSYSGFPGLCTDPKTGLYIGGHGNDCRHTRSNKGVRCVVHAQARRAPRAQGQEELGGRSHRKAGNRTL